MASLLDHLSNFHGFEQQPCLVVRLLGLDGAMGMPGLRLAHLEGATSLEGLDEVHQVYAQWVPALLAHAKIRTAAQHIHDELSSSSLRADMAICLHVRVSSCTTEVIEGASLDSKHRTLALSMAEQRMRAWFGAWSTEERSIAVTPAKEFAELLEVRRPCMADYPGGMYVPFVRACMRIHCRSARSVCSSSGSRA